METAQNHGSLATFQRKERMVKQDRHQPANGVHRRRRLTAHRRLRKCRNTKVEGNVCGECDDDDDDDDDDEKARIEKRIMALQRIVPGGESLGVDKLFEETAGYILALQGQVKAMKVLASFFEDLQQSSKLGG